MADRSKRRAVESLADSLRACLLCISRQPSALLPTPREGFYRFEFLPAGGTVHLKRAYGLQRLPLLLSYELSARPLDGNARWLSAAIVSYWVEIDAGTVSYHWHPAGASPVRTPHLHVKTEASSSRKSLSLDRAHLPTGPVSLAAIVRFLIEELGVEPNRADWARVLAETETAI